MDRAAGTAREHASRGSSRDAVDSHLHRVRRGLARPDDDRTRSRQHRSHHRGIVARSGVYERRAPCGVHAGARRARRALVRPGGALYAGGGVSGTAADAEAVETPRRGSPMKGAAGVWARRATLLAVSGLLLAGNLAFFLWYRSTMRQRQEALERRRAALAKAVEAIEDEAARLGRQRGHLLQVSEALDEFYGQRVGPQRETLAPRIDELHAILRRVGITPSDIRYLSAPVKDLPLTELKISFGFHN